MLPLQFSWAAVASYSGHEGQASTGCFGHYDHDHAHHADASSDAGLATDLSADASSPLDETGGAEDGRAPCVMDLDLGRCHDTCSMMLICPLVLLGAQATAPPSATLDRTGGAHAPT
jgi:hypothetical protein